MNENGSEVTYNQTDPVDAIFNDLNAISDAVGRMRKHEIKDNLQEMVDILFPVVRKMRDAEHPREREGAAQDCAAVLRIVVLERVPADHQEQFRHLLGKCNELLATMQTSDQVGIHELVLLARDFGTSHHKIQLSARNIEAHVKEAVQHLADMSKMHSQIREEVHHVRSGLLGDEG